LVTNFDADRQTLFFATTGYDRDGRRGVLVVSEALRGALQERFPDIKTLEFGDGYEAARPEFATDFTIRLTGGDALSVDVVEQGKRSLSSVVEEVVRAHGLRPDEDAPLYYAGRRVGVSPYERDLVLLTREVTNTTLHVRITHLRESYATLHSEITADLAARLTAAFGSSAVTRQDSGTD
jgi:hypothetical protein